MLEIAEAPTPWNQCAERERGRATQERRRKNERKREKGDKEMAEPSRNEKMLFELKSPSGLFACPTRALH